MDNGSGGVEINGRVNSNHLRNEGIGYVVPEKLRTRPNEDVFRLVTNIYTYIAMTAGQSQA